MRSHAIAQMYYYIYAIILRAWLAPSTEIACLNSWNDTYCVPSTAYTYYHNFPLLFLNLIIINVFIIITIQLGRRTFG